MTTEEIKRKQAELQSLLEKTELLAANDALAESQRQVEVHRERLRQSMEREKKLQEPIALLQKENADLKQQIAALQKELDQSKNTIAAMEAHPDVIKARREALEREAQRLLDAAAKLKPVEPTE